MRKLLMVLFLLLITTFGVVGFLSGINDDVVTIDPEPTTGVERLK